MYILKDFSDSLPPQLNIDLSWLHYPGVCNYRYSEPFEILQRAIAATNSSKVLKTQVQVAKIFEPNNHAINTKQKQVLTPAFALLREQLYEFRTLNWAKIQRDYDLFFSQISALQTVGS